LFTVEEGLEGFLFVLKLNENTWLKCMGSDFYIPLLSSSSLPAKSRQGLSESAQIAEDNAEANQKGSISALTTGIINEIRNLVSDISYEKGRKTKTKEAQEIILQEIEKLAAEAYSIFRSSIPTFSEEAVVEFEELKPAVKICSGTGTGFEVLCQGFNWESQKSGRWYMELKERASELSSLGFTVIWLPPPTESVSLEGYMPKDLYNLNSRYYMTSLYRYTICVGSSYRICCVLYAKNSQLALEPSLIVTENLSLRKRKRGYYTLEGHLLS
jgi:alpha-amylase